MFDPVSGTYKDYQFLEASVIGDNILVDLGGQGTGWIKIQ